MLARHDVFGRSDIWRDGHGCSDPGRPQAGGAFVASLVLPNAPQDRTKKPIYDESVENVESNCDSAARTLL